MPQLTALSLSIAVLGAIWAYVALSSNGLLLVWAGFIAWGCFFHSGGDQKALIKTICGTIYGAIVAWIALLIITHLPENSMGALLPAIVVGVTVFFLVIVASVEQLSAVPAQVYGYAATVAYSLQTPTDATAGTGPLANLTSASTANPLIIMIISFVIGAVLGMVSGKLAGALTKKA